MQVTDTASRREPALNIPTPVVVWIGLLVAIHAGRALLSTKADLLLLLNAAFVPASWSVALGWASPEAVLAAVEAGLGKPEGALRLALAGLILQERPPAWSPVSYSLLHGSWSHLAVNSLLIVVFGSSVVRRSGAVSSLALWLVAAFGGAFAHWLHDPLDVDLMLGASASASSLMAAAATFLFTQPGQGRWGFLRSRGALVLLGLWLGANALVGIVLEPLGWADADMAWAAHIGGLLVGITLYPLLTPSRHVRS